MYESKLLIFLISLSVLFSVLSASPVFEPSENVVDDNAPDDAGFERSNDGFPDMNDFSFEPEGMSNANKEQDAGANQSGEQVDEDGPPPGVRERPSIGEMNSSNKATAEEQEGGEDDGPNEGHGGRNEAGPPQKQKYADGDESAARSLDQFEPFDKSFDKEADNLEKNEFDANTDEQLNGNNSGEQGPMRGNHLPIPPPALQIDEPILMNGGPMPLHGGGGGRPMSGRSNNDENEGGGKYNAKPKRPMKTDKGAPLGYKFLPSGIKYLHEKPGVSKTRIAQPNLASFTDHLSAGNLLMNVFNDPKPELNQVVFNPLHGLQTHKS